LDVESVEGEFAKARKRRVFGAFGGAEGEVAEEEDPEESGTVVAN